MSRTQQQQVAQTLVGRRVTRVEIHTGRNKIPGSPGVLATLHFDDGTKVETEHVSGPPQQECACGKRALKGRDVCMNCLAAGDLASRE